MTKFKKKKEERKRRGLLFFLFDVNYLASLMTSTVIHIGLILLALFLWVEPWTFTKRSHIYKPIRINAIYDFERDEEELEEDEDVGEREDVAKKADGEEGKFGDPDVAPEIHSKVPRNEGKIVSKIDPKKIGLIDVLKGNKVAAITSILSNNAHGLNNKMAIAMAGAGSEFVMGHGSGGMGFKGTGTGGGGEDGYGRIHGLGKIDAGIGGGTKIRFGGGRKKVKKVGNLRLGSGKSAGFCKRSNIMKVVRRRSGAIKNCYEQQLQVNAKLRGRITTRWTIGLDGTVAKATITSDTVNNNKVAYCILRVVRRMRFPKPEGGGMCVIQWPFIFNNSN